MFNDIFKNLQDKKPLVHNITNYVTATDCANITLAVGASPIMADEPLEVNEVTQIADSLVINTGTISERRLKSMLISGKMAHKQNIPIVLDPVGAGVSKFRTDAVTQIISSVRPDIIRMNTSELKSICLNTKNISGVDAVNDDDIQSITPLAKELANKTGSIIGITGALDIVTDGNKAAVIKSGHEMMRKITGAGCMLSSVTGAFAAANKDNLFDATVCAFALFGKCGKNAYRDNIGVGTYKVNFFDEMSKTDLEGIEVEYR